MKLLYVEDEEKTRNILSDFLQKHFEEILVAENGLDALDIFKHNDIDIVLTDLHMPKMDGLNLIKNIKSINSDIPVIVLTAYSDHNILIDCIQLNVDGYILKPIDLELVFKEIRKAEEKIKLQNRYNNNLKLLNEYKAALDASSIVSKTNHKGIITYVNKAFCDISGYTKEELIGKNHNIIRHPDTPASVFKNMWNTIKAKERWQGIIKNKTKSGSSYYVDSHIIPILNEKNEIEEYIGIRHDITQLELYKENIEHELEIATKDIIETQKEVVFTMGAIGETRSKETGNHVKRVAEYSRLLGELYGLDNEKVILLKQASPMHDIGKVGISDDILNKPGALTKEEFEIMKTHTTLGYEMLKHSHREILEAASIIAYQHHEKWDGSGYPRGLQGEEIHIYGRITAIADVFDALGHDRVYKKAWPDEKIFELLRNESGKHFDPHLIDLFFVNLDKFLEIRKSLLDVYE